MKTITLNRPASTTKGVFGVFLHNGVPFAVSIERPWDNNKPFFSCIPFGVYTCKLIHSPKFGTVFEVIDVPGRTKILIHAANRAEELQGCIAPGTSYGILKGQPAVLGSRDALKKYMGIVGNGEHILKVVNCFSNAKAMEV